MKLTKTALAAAALAAALIHAPTARGHGSTLTSLPSTQVTVTKLSTPSHVILNDARLTATPGECFARVKEPARFESVTEQVLVKPASERVEVIPARYETITETVLVKPATTRVIDVPARYEWVDEQTLVSPATTEWRSADCSALGAVRNSTGECACLVNVPAVYGTTRKQVLVEPASTRVVDVPAEYETVQKTVMASPARERRIAVPAEFTTVTREFQVSPARDEWVRIGCSPSHAFTLDRMSTIRLQRNLRAAGYEPGIVDGVFSESTRRALESYQRDHGLPIGSCDSLTLEALGL